MSVVYNAFIFFHGCYDDLLRLKREGCYETSFPKKNIFIRSIFGFYQTPKTQSSSWSKTVLLIYIFCGNGWWVRHATERLSPSLKFTACAALLQHSNQASPNVKICIFIEGQWRWNAVKKRWSRWRCRDELSHSQFNCHQTTTLSVHLGWSLVQKYKDIRQKHASAAAALQNNNNRLWMQSCRWWMTWKYKYNPKTRA